MSKTETVVAAPDQPPPEKARPRGLAGLSTALQAMAQIERVMEALPPSQRPTVAAWYDVTYVRAKGETP